MRKNFIIAFLAAIILACAGIVTIKLLSFGPEQSYFNLYWRYRLTHYPVVRDILNLHSPGDARADFLGDRYQGIEIEVGTMKGELVSTSTLQDFAQEVTRLTHKDVTDHPLNDLAPYATSSTDGEIKGAIESYPNPPPHIVALRVLFLNASDHRTDILGSTYGDNGIIIFEDSLRRFASASPQTFEAYEFSTLLHEFGHQLGLSHNTLPGCLMNEHAETDRQPRKNPGEVVVDFCPYEQGLIAHMKY